MAQNMHEVEADSLKEPFSFDIKTDTDLTNKSCINI